MSNKNDTVIFICKQLKMKQMNRSNGTRSILTSVFLKKFVETAV